MEGPTPIIYIVTALAILYLIFKSFDDGDVF